MKLRDVVANLNSEPLITEGSITPIIYAAEPWTPSSEALVAAGSLDGGLASEAASKSLVRLFEVAGALAILKPNYADLWEVGDYDGLCRILVTRVDALVAAGDPYGYKALK